MISLAIVTPTYNRDYIIGALYESILMQKKHHIQLSWYIVDDGSIDQTEALIESFIQEAPFKIIYKKQENMGKMEAINQIMPHLNEDYCIEIDSDDFLVDDAMQLLEPLLLRGLGDDSIGFLVDRIDKNGEVIGKQYPNPIKKNIVELYYNHYISGDKNFIFNTKKRKAYHYKLCCGERFSTEARMYQQMAIDGFVLEYYPIPIVVCEYQEDGYSLNIKNIYKNNPWTHYYYYQELINFKIKVSIKVRFHILKQYLLFHYLTHQKYSTILKDIESNKFKVLLTLLYLPSKLKASSYMK